MVLLIHPGFSTFVKADFLILKKHHQLKVFHYQTGKKLLINIKSQAILFFWLLKNIFSAKNVYIWFADYHSFLPIIFSRIFRKKSIIVLGGYEVTYLPEIKYGSFSNPLRSFFTGYSLKNADFICPVDGSLIDEMFQRVQNIKGQIIVNPTGYDPDRWFCDRKKENVVLTVAICQSMQRVKLKGIDFFCQVASQLPEYNFWIVGLGKNILKEMTIPANVSVYDKMELDELREIYARAKVYAQFSLREGLPNAVCEAMLSECISVGSKVNGIPSAIGDCGFLIDGQNLDEAIHSIKQAIQSPASLGKKARSRIMENFTIQKREEILVRILKS
jgi:glycosyltransferase involved in cell wall biosynthesis